jgi:hypothetical protein
MLMPEWSRASWIARRFTAVVDEPCAAVAFVPASTIAVTTQMRFQSVGVGQAPGLEGGVHDDPLHLKPALFERR